MRPLWEIEQDMRRLLDAMDGVSAEEEIAAWNAWAKDLSAESGAKLDAYVNADKLLEMEEVAANAEMEQWKMRRDARRAARTRLKDNMQSLMVTMGVDELTTERGYRICLQQNGGQVPIVYDEEALQKMTAEEKAEYVEFVPGLIKTAVRKALEAGHELSFARLGHHGKHVRIRT